jgi:hypothetical protein
LRRSQHSVADWRIGRSASRRPLVLSLNCHSPIACARRVITRLECGPQGTNPRYVVTNLTGDPKALYDDMYCQRGEAENRIKEAQVGLFATRTICRYFQSNQLRVLLAALGYVLIERL